jgi:stage III sporulation protein AA
VKDIDEILRYFSNQLYTLIKNVLIQDIKLQRDLQEIRIRVGRPILLKTRQADIIIDYEISTNEILQTLERLCENSIYAYKNQICEGFLTVKGGHRVGITGSAVIEKNEIINLKYITSLNFRIAREVINCSKNIIKEIINVENNSIYNTLIVSPPGKGKTTILRDIIRNISNGINEINFKGMTCGVVDERGEIAAMYKGVPQNDIGIRTDVIENISKSKGIKMLIRSMAPEIIACDEIGSKEDIQAIRRGYDSRCKRNIYYAWKNNRRHKE